MSTQMSLTQDELRRRASAMTDSPVDEQRRANVTLLKKLGVVVVGMFGFGYRWCRSTTRSARRPDCATSRSPTW